MIINKSAELQRNVISKAFTGKHKGGNQGAEGTE